jgi:hypothetical protein
VNALSDILGHLSPAAAYTVVAAAVLAESVLLVGAFVPTLTLLLTAGALARTGQVDLLLVIAAAAGAVVAGDFLAHRTGRYLGDRLRGGHMGRRVPDAAWGRAESLMTRHGGRAVCVARTGPCLMRHLCAVSSGFALSPLFDASGVPVGVSLLGWGRQVCHSACCAKNPCGQGRRGPRLLRRAEELTCTDVRIRQRTRGEPTRWPGVA